MSTNASDLFNQMSPGESTGGRAYGVVEGKVSDVDRNGRVKVEFPWMPMADGKPYVTRWTRVVAPGAGGKGRGLLLPLAKGDEVLVAFRFGNFEQPYVLGGLWNTKTDRPPSYPFKDEAENVNLNRSILRSKSGLVIVVDDTEGKEKITIADEDDQVKMEFDVANVAMAITVAKTFSITVGSGSDKTSVTVEKGKVTVECNELELKASQKCDVAVGGTTIKAETGKLEMKSPKVTINDPALEVT